MVYGFIQQFSGKLQIISELGHGTYISLLLPSGKEPSELPQKVDENLTTAGNGEVILIVEDQEDLMQVFRGDCRSGIYRQISRKRRAGNSIPCVRHTRRSAVDGRGYAWGGRWVSIGATRT